MTPTEINEAVARGLGFSCQCDCHNQTTHSCVCGFNGRCQYRIPNYCGSIEAAWEIVEKYPFIPDGRCEAWFQLMRRHENEMVPEVKIWEAGWARYDDCMILSAYADTAPMAICLAYLKLNASL